MTFSDNPGKVGGGEKKGDVGGKKKRGGEFHAAAYAAATPHTRLPGVLSENKRSKR